MMNSTTLAMSRDVAFLAGAAVVGILLLNDLRPRPTPAFTFFAPIEPFPTVDSAVAANTAKRGVNPRMEPVHGWLYALRPYVDGPVRIRPALAAELEATQQTKHVEGVGVFARVADGAILRNDADAYPPLSSERSWRREAGPIYCWVAE